MRVTTCGMLAALGAAMLSIAAPQSTFAQPPGDSTVLTIRISLSMRQLWVIDKAGDTLLTTSIAVGSGRTLVSETRSWTFRTPVGETRVVAKQENPVWVPPDWHYVELAGRRGLGLARLPLDTPVLLSGRRFLLVKNLQVGIMGRDSVFQPLIPTEEIVFDGKLFIPPFGTEQRRVEGTLGQFRLLLANGVGLHGTDAPDSIGRAVTHGCIRLRDEAIAWLYENVPLGTRVVIY